jgi:hypothetical protein
VTSSIWLVAWTFQVLAKGDPEWAMLWLLAGAVALVVDLALFCPAPRRRPRGRS